MARLKGPLMSLQASGKLADTLVYAAWKGIPYVRSKVDPANPKTAAQQAIRAYVTLACSYFNSTNNPVNALHRQCLDRGALYSGKIMSGFNLYVKQWIDTKEAGSELAYFFNLAIASITDTGASVTVGHQTQTKDVKLYYGSSPTVLVNSVTRTEADVVGYASTFALAGLSALTTYYYSVKNLTADATDNTGIGKFTTVAS